MKIDYHSRFARQLSIFLLVGGALISSSLVWDEQIGVKASTRSFFPRVQSNPPSTQSTVESTPLAVTDVVERELQAEQKQSFTVRLEANQYVRIEVEQQEIDVIVRLFDPAGKQVQEMDSPNGTKGPEHLRHVTVEAGTYRVEVAGLEKGAKPGKYTIRLGELRSAQTTDTAIIQYDQLVQQAKALADAGRYRDALPVVEKIVNVARQAYGEKSVQHSTALYQFGFINFQTRNFPTAEAAFLQALTILENQFGKEHIEIPSILNNLAAVYKAQRDFTRAETMILQAIAIDEKLLGTTHLRIAQHCNNLGELYRVQNKFDLAESTFRTALSKLDHTRQDHKLHQGNILNNLAITLHAKGDYIQAVELLKKVVVNRREVFGEKHPEFAKGLHNLAEGYRQIGRYSEMEPLMRQALAIYQAANGPDSFETASCLNNLGEYYRAIGNFGLTERYLLQALALWEKIGARQNPEFCSTLLNLGAQAETRNDLQTAGKYYQRALATQTGQSTKNDLLLAGILQHLTQHAVLQGNLDQSIEYHFQALMLIEKALPPTHPAIFAEYVRAAKLYQLKGDHTQARTWLEKAQGLLHKQPNPRTEDVHKLLAQYGEFWFKVNDYEKAESYLNQAISLEHQLPAKSLVLPLMPYIQLFWIQVQKQNFLKAAEYLTHIQNQTEAQRVNNLVIGSETQKKLFLSQRPGFHLTIWFHLTHQTSNPELARLALQGIIRQKGRALDAMVENIRTLRQYSSSDGQALLDELFVIRNRISNLMVRGPGKGTVEAYRARLADLENQSNELENKLSAASFQYRQQATPIYLNDIQAAIPHQTTLVEYMVYTPQQPPKVVEGAARYVVYTLDRTGKIGFADLGEKSEIDSLVKEFRQALAAVGDQRNLTKIKLSTARRLSLSQVQKLARQLDAKLMQPVRKFIGDKDHLLISPDGALNLIPFAALVDESHRYLVESHNITYLSSGRDLLRLKDKIQSSQPALALANPAFDQGPGPQIFGQHFDPLIQLPGSEQEGKFLKSLFPKTQLKQGATATETILKQANQPEILHIATHGHFLEPDQATQTLTQTLETRSLSLGLSDQTVSPEFVRQSSPLLRSMLFFSGANRRASTTETTDDGILTALEVASLNLWGTKLVVLSACDTGVGEVKRGDGVYGLRRALVLAGSESQVISLWPVSDAGTRELMFKFYRRLKAGEGRSQALRNAQLDLIKTPKRNHPSFWASFIQSGEWANLDGKRKE